MSRTLIPAGRGPALPLGEGESISVINVTGTPVVDCTGDYGTFREGASFHGWWTGPVAIELPRTASWLLLSADEQHRLQVPQASSHSCVSMQSDSGRRTLSRLCPPEEILKRGSDSAGNRAVDEAQPMLVPLR
jgi:hypothetical protein